MNGPQRIVCLTEEPTEILYALGEQERIVGISAYTVRPPEAKRDKPVVSAFVGGSVPKIKALEPDLVIGFSDIQADLARELIAENLQVLIFNQRSLDEIAGVIVDLGSLVARREAALALVDGYRGRIDRIANESARRGARPRVYFEEWDDPMICGIQWVSELIEIAGGEDIFADRARGKLARERFVDEAAIAAANPRPSTPARRWGRSRRCASSGWSKSPQRSSCNPGPRVSPTDSTVWWKSFLASATIRPPVEPTAERQPFVPRNHRRRRRLARRSAHHRSPAKRGPHGPDRRRR